MSQQPNSANQLLTLPGGGGGDMDDADIGGGSTPWWRRRRTIIGISVLLLIILLGALIFSLLNRKTPTTYQYQQVKTGDMAITVSATGPLTSSVYNLMFNGSGGILSEIDVSLGQKVTKGQLVAKLDKTSLQDAYNQQVAAVQAAQDNLNSALNDLAKIQGVANANTAASQNTANNSQNNLNATQNTSQATINSAQTTLNNDQSSLNQTRNVQNATVAAAQTTLNNAQSSLNQARNVQRTSVSAAQATLNSSLAACNTAATATAAAGNTSATATASARSTSGTATATARSTSATATAAARSATPTATATTTGDTGTVFFTRMGISLGAMPSQTCQEAAYATYNASVAAANSTLQTAQNTVNSAQKSLTQAQATANSTIQTAQAAVNSAQQSLTQAQATANQSNTSAAGSASNDKQSINTTNANGASSLASAQQSVITNQGTLSSAKALLDTDKHNLSNSILRAPHSGTVTTINGTVGSSPGVAQNASNTSTSASSTVFVQVVDANSIQVQANVNETDTANIKVGESATFTVNAYSNKQFTGKVTGISPNGNTVSNVVTFPVYIDVDKNSLNGANLIPGMTANITITAIDRPNSLLIPVNAINFARLASTGSKTSTTPQLVTPQAASTATSQARQLLITLQSQSDVSADSPVPAYVIESAGDSKFVAKPVVLGLTDGTNYAVLSGLTTGDTVVVGTKSTSTSSSSSSSGGATGG